MSDCLFFFQIYSSGPRYGLWIHRVGRYRKSRSRPNHLFTRRTLVFRIRKYWEILGVQSSLRTTMSWRTVRLAGPNDGTPSMGSPSKMQMRWSLSGSPFHQAKNFGSEVLCLPKYSRRRFHGENIFIIMNPYFITTFSNFVRFTSIRFSQEPPRRCQYKQWIDTEKVLSDPTSRVVQLELPEQYRFTKKQFERGEGSSHRG